MKKIAIILLGAVMTCSCGVGAYSLSSGKADEGMISFTGESKTPISVIIDGTAHDNICTVKTKDWRKDRNIKKTAQNTIFLTPGKHNVVVRMNGKEVCSRNVFISAQEHKVIEL